MLPSPLIIVRLSPDPETKLSSCGILWPSASTLSKKTDTVTGLVQIIRFVMSILTLAVVLLCCDETLTHFLDISVKVADMGLTISVILTYYMKVDHTLRLGYLPFRSLA